MANSTPAISSNTAPGSFSSYNKNPVNNSYEKVIYTTENFSCQIRDRGFPRSGAPCQLESRQRPQRLSKQKYVIL